MPTDDVTGAVTGRFGKIYLARIDGSSEELITSPGNTGMLVGWSADARHVLFIADDLGTDHLWAVRIQEGRPNGAPISIAKELARGEGHTVSATICAANGAVALAAALGSPNMYQR